MNLKSRIKKLEGGTGSTCAPVQIIFVKPKASPNNPAPLPVNAFAYFTEFYGEQLVAEPGEDFDVFEARCQEHLAWLSSAPKKPEVPECL
ncbi:MAG TPA: hypothetical protein DEO85_14950 [Maritimibacter sp.]|nr:hypothetical protein [Maritimibacter sp.]